MVGRVIGTQALPAFVLGGRYLAGTQGRGIAAPDVRVESHEHGGGVGVGHRRHGLVEVQLTAIVADLTADCGLTDQQIAARQVRAVVQLAPQQFRDQSVGFGTPA